MFKSVLVNGKQNFGKSATFNKVLKSFARREINKGHLINQNILTASLINNISDKKFDVNAKINIEKEPHVFTVEQSDHFIEGNILTKESTSDSKVDKFFRNEIRNFLNSSGLLENEKFINSIREISINYSQNNFNFSKSTLFKFLCLVDQILNERSLEFYNNADVTHLVFSHLIDTFNINFSILFLNDPQFLLKYNFLYFMSINQGEFSQALQVVFDHFATKNLYKEKINRLMNTKIVIRNENEPSLYSLLNNNKYFQSLERNVKTPSSDLIKDYTFKYNQVETKERLINESVSDKKTYEKLKWTFNTLKSLQNFDIQPDAKFLKNLEIFLSTNFIEKSEYFFGNDYQKLKESLNDSNRYLQAKLNHLTKLKESELKVKVNFENLYDVFNPLFSGETNLATQFSKVSNTFDHLFSLNLLRKFIENSSDSTFNDLLRMNLILSLKFGSIERIFKEVSFINYDMNTINTVELNLKRMRVQSQKFVINVTDKIYKQEIKKTEFSEQKKETPQKETKKESPKVEKKQTFVVEKKQTFVVEKTELIKEEQTINTESPKIKNKEGLKFVINIKRSDKKIDESKTEKLNEEVKQTEDPKNEEKITTEATPKILEGNVNTSEKVSESAEPPQSKELNDSKLSVASSHEDHAHNTQVDRASSHDMNAKREKTSFYKNTKKGFCAKQFYNTDESSDKKPSPKFIVPPKESKENTNDLLIKNKVDLNRPKSIFVIPPKEKETDIKITKIEEKKEKVEKVENKAKFVIPPKVKEEIPATKDEITESEKTQHREERKNFKFIVPPKSETTIQKKPEIKVAIQQAEQVFDLIEKKKKIINVPISKTKSSESALLEKLDELTVELQNIKRENLFFTYAETNQEAIDLERATEKYNLEYWIKKIYNEEFDEEMEAEEAVTHIHTRLAKVFRKYSGDREKTLMIVYSLINPEIKSEFLLDLEYSFYQIFSNELTHQIFSKLNLGHLGYQCLLNNCLLDNSMENRRSFEKIIKSAEKSYYTPNNDNIKTIIDICDKNYYPKYLKVIIDNYVLNKNVKLTTQNYTKYVQIMSNFEELNEYCTNLITNSFIDFQIPIQVQFYEFILFNNLKRGEYFEIEKTIKYLKLRYASDYQNEVERAREMANGMKFVFNLCHEYLQDILMSEKTNKSGLFSVMNNLVSDIQFLDRKWKSDLQFTRRLFDFYSVSDNEKYLNIIGSYLSESQTEILNKSDFINVSKMLFSFKLTLDKEKETEIKNKIVNSLDQFLEEFLHTEIFSLNYEEKFNLLREENFSKIFRFFNSFEKEAKMKSLQNLLEVILDPLTFVKLPNKDKRFLESHLNRIFEYKRSNAIEFISRVDVLR